MGAATEAEFVWQGGGRGQPDRSEESDTLGVTAELRKRRRRFDYLRKGQHEALDFELPCAAGGDRRRWIDTAQA